MIHRFDDRHISPDLRIAKGGTAFPLGLAPVETSSAKESK